ncbi:ABC transporter permease [Aliiroseovarius sp. PTFE2010]|uniref:ABC transporter permease n=1 Tax=Aliiroseovarius sp. PTFE2010 TaxID=3417190 RepID=UPI003CE878E1
MTRHTSVGELLILQVRVIASLVIRETRATFGTSNFGYLWAIITPTASVGVLVFVFTLVGRQAPFGSSLALFFGTGIMALQYFSELSHKLNSVFNANRALLTYPVIRELDTLIARALLIAATYLAIMVLFFGALISLGLAPWPSHPEALILAFITTWLLGFGMGLMNAVVSSMWDTWTQVERVLTRPLFFVSAIFYVPSQLPPEAIAVLKWNPVLHLVEWMREGFYPRYNSMVLDKSYVLMVATLLILLGLAGERLFRKKRTN